MINEEVIPMPAVMFNFHSNIPLEQQEVLLAQLSTWDGISKVGRLKPDAQRSELLRMCYAYVEDNADVKPIVMRLSALPEIESASIPAVRRLIK